MTRHFNHCLKKLHAYHKTHLQHPTSQPHHRSFAEVLLIKILLFSTTEMFACSKVINAFKRQNSWTNPFRKSSTSFEYAVLVTSRHLFSLSTVSARNASDRVFLLACTHENNPTPPPQKKCLHFQSLTSKASGNKKLQSALRIVIY